MEIQVRLKGYIDGLIAICDLGIFRIIRDPVRLRVNLQSMRQKCPLAVSESIGSLRIRPRFGHRALNLQKQTSAPTAHKSAQRYLSLRSPPYNS